MSKINHCLNTRKTQQGAVTLVITVIILVAMMLGIVALVVTSTMETRMVSNDQRSRQAMERAQAGIDYLVAGLGSLTIDRAYLCASDTRATRGFVIDFRLPVGKSCSTVPFEILTKLDSIRSWGYSDDLESVRVIESTIDLTTPWNFGTAAGTVTGGGGDAAVVSKLTVDFQGTPEAARCNLSGQSYLCSELAKPGNQSGLIEGTLVRAGGAIGTQGNIPMGSGNLAGNDATLAAMSNDQLFSDFFSSGMDKTAFKNSAYQFTQSGNKTDVDTVNTNAGNNQNIYVNGDLTLNNGTLGSPDKPVAIFVDGNLVLKGNVIIWGEVYAQSADFSVGTNKILGSLVSEGAVNMKGNAAVYYNPGLRPDPNTVDPAGLVATATGRDSTVRIGSWRELSLPAAQAPQ
jgi:hypothetical protein